MNHEAAPHVTGTVRLWLRAEALALMLAGVVLYARTGEGGGRFFALLFIPDLSLLAYALGPRAGAVAYNLAHSSVGALALAAAVYLGVVPAAALPLVFIWLVHIGMDRALGFGLKYGSAFGHTHLGVVGAQARPLPAAAAA